MRDRKSACHFVAMLLVLLAGRLTAQTWTSIGPVPRFGQSAVLDSNNNRMVVFGGLPFYSSSNNNLNDVWVLNSNNQAWISVAPSGTAPAPRTGHSAILDSGTNRMVVFGGALGRSSPCANDVWLLTRATALGGASAWTQLNPSGAAPAPRLQHGAVYDLNTNTMIVFGGQDCFRTLFGDVWTLSHANGKGGTPTWTELAPSGGGPGPREITGGVTYDSTTNRLIVFGGTNGVLSNDVWVLTNANGHGGSPVWQQLAPSGTLPPPRAINSSIYDSATNRLVIFGGEDNNAALLGDVWVLTGANGLGGTPVWTQLAGFATFPQARAYHSSVYNSLTNKMTIFGGDIGLLNGGVNVVSNDVWVLDHANGQ